MYRIDSHAQRSAVFGGRGITLTGPNEVRWAKTVRLSRSIKLRAAMIGMNTRIEHAWVVSVTALAGRRRTG
jgi:hypothetical protein